MTKPHCEFCSGLFFGLYLEIEHPHKGCLSPAHVAQSQVPWGLNALNGEVTEASWRTKPSWYLVATDDRMIPPAAQRFMSKRAGSTVRESPGSHAIYVSRPAPVVALIEQAAASHVVRPRLAPPRTKR